jgi:predicted Zn-dependent protease
MAGDVRKARPGQPLNDNGAFPYLRSHPLTVDRISEARNRTLLDHAPTRPPTMLHGLMQARSRVLMDESAQGLHRLNGGTSSPVLADRVGALYAAAMAASLLKEHGRAETQATEALRLAATATPREPAAERVLTLLQAQLRLARGDAPAALATLDGLGAAATERAPMLLRAQAALALQPGPAEASTTLRGSTEALQTWLADHPQDANAWELLSRTSAALGLGLRAMRADAEARAAVGDLTGAIDRLRTAQQVSRSATGQDFIEGSVIDARLRQISATRRQLALELRGDNRRVPGPDEPLPPQ